jgi:hypothetical protein
MKTILTSLVLLISIVAQSQNHPSFGPEIDVIINELTFDAMEPFISPDGNYLFFNNLNDGVNTKLYYATKTTDSTFNYVGELNGANQITTPYLDAVADMDSLNNFYWTSTRDYPVELDNLFHGTFNTGNITSIGRVRGNFNKSSPGWLVMDHGISYDGQLLYYNNARFDNNNCQGPCETEIGIALKVNDSTFNQIPNSNFILQNVNDTNFIYYAPCISSDNLELYYTRYPKDTITLTTLFEICVAVRSSPIDTFSIPIVLFSELISDMIEAPTLTADKQIIYYHKKIVDSHKIVMRYRDNPSSNAALSEKEMPISIYPNPTNGILNIKTDLKYQKINLSVLTLIGTELVSTINQTQIDINSIPSGIYFLKIVIDSKTEIKKILKAE